MYRVVARSVNSSLPLGHYDIDSIFVNKNDALSFLNYLDTSKYIFIHII